jgi:hypothetical protein
MMLLGKTLLAVSLILGSGGQYARELPPLAAERLTTIELFAFGGIGFAGKTSEGEMPFRVVMEKPHGEALRSMEEIFANGSAAAKSYALVGVRKLAPERFEALYQSIAHSQEKVHTMSGCIGSTRTLKELANEIRSGAYDKSLPLH